MKTHTPHTNRNLLGLGKESDCGANGSSIAILYKDLGEIALLEGLHIHVSLVRFNHHQDVASRNLVALALSPLHDLALSHGRGESRHEDGSGAVRKRRAAASRLGRRGSGRGSGSGSGRSSATNNNLADIIPARKCYV